jgi:hypothetical protein
MVLIQLSEDRQCECLQRSLDFSRGRESVNRGLWVVVMVLARPIDVMKLPADDLKVLVEAVRVPIEAVRVPVEAARLPIEAMTDL